jgi:hypothetical protein
MNLNTGTARPLIFRRNHNAVFGPIALSSSNYWVAIYLNAKTFSYVPANLLNQTLSEMELEWQ